MGLYTTIHSYFSSHWESLGGEHFIALCTGLNLALLSWAQFQERLRHAENRLEEKLAKASASLADSNSANHLKRLAERVHRFLRWLGKTLWSVIYILALCATAAGFVMLYTRTSCPFDFFLLLPVVAHLAWSWVALFVFGGWLWLMQRGISFFGPPQPDHKSAEIAISAFAKETENKLDVPKPPPPPEPPVGP